MAMNQSCYGLDGRLGRRGTFTYFSTRQVVSLLQKGAHGSVFDTITRDSFERIHIPVPPVNVVDKFEEMIDPYLLRIQNNLVESSLLANLRDTLLPKLISGEIRVRAMAAQRPNMAVTHERANAPQASDQFKEAILIAALVRATASAQHPLGNFRRTKLSYLIHRKAGYNVQTRYLKKAAGPYDPKSKYAGPIKISIQNGYVKEISSAKSKGLVSGVKAELINKYLPRYGFADAIAWVLQRFRFSKDNELELFTTVDFAALEVKEKGRAISVDAIIGVLEADAEWKPKLDRPLFSPENIRRALQTMAIHFPETYKGMCL